MKKLLHKIAHLLNINFGTVVSEYRGKDLWIGFHCYGCGEYSGWYKSRNKIKKSNDNIKKNKTK